MYAIIKTGGKQYRVNAGDTLKVEKIDRALGESFDITDVLFVDGEAGAPVVKSAKVNAVVTEHGRDAKVLVFKKKRRKGFRKTRGHRQEYTKIFIQAITSGKGETVKAANKPLVVDFAKNAERKQAYLAKVEESGVKPVKKEKKVAAAKKPAAKKAGKKKAKKKAAKKASKK